jgi:hypothetical protein
MHSRDFCFWLQGLFEIANPQELDARATDLIKRHLALVFKHEIDPSMPDPTGELQAIHDGQPAPPSPQPTPWVPANLPPTQGPGDTLYRC